MQPRTLAPIEPLLANLPLFRELGPPEIARFAARARTAHHERGETIFHRGDAAQGIHVVASGQVKLAFNSARGDEKVVELIGPGQSFGEAVMFTGRPYPVTATALVDSMVVCVDKQAIFAEVDADPMFARRVIAGLCRRIHALMADVEAYSLSSGTQRVIGYLLRDCDLDTPSPVDVTLPTTKGVVSSRLNVTQEHFSRILHDLSARGLIEVHGRTIRLLDLARLRNFEP